MAELKPCPFCGGEPYFYAADRIINIGCYMCRYHRYWKGLITTDKEAIEEWNWRAE